MQTKPPTFIPIAKKHPAHYLMHKYWARKPHNVVRDYIEFFTQKGDIVFDPFGGSGVTAIEAIKSERIAINVDINPISNHIIEGTCIPVKLDEFEKELGALKNSISSWINSLYSTKCEKCGNKSEIIYTVWSQIIKCEECKEKFPVIESKKMGRKYRCTKCSFLNKTKYSVKREESPYEIKYHCTHCVDNFNKKLSEEEIKSIMKIQNQCSDIKLDGELCYNPRTLVEENMKVSDLFTRRNLLILLKIRENIEKISNKNLKKTMLFIFTASVAQSSRLIAYRQGLTTGGPAWTVSGFWIPSTNMEINPLNNFLNKAKKIVNGKKEISDQMEHVGILYFKKAKNFEELNMSNRILILNESINFITKEKIPDDSVHYIFTDPPYGDSVPYLEYSALWTSWLGNKLDYKNEIIISNSPIRKKTIEDYSVLLTSAFQNCYRILKTEGWMTVTFHNRFLESWEVLLNAIENAGFEYMSANYLVPTILPAKAQLSECSLEGDLIMHFKKTRLVAKNANLIKTESLEKEIIDRVKKVLKFMGGRSHSSQIWNSIILLLLEKHHQNIQHGKINPTLKSQFIISNGYYELKNYQKLHDNKFSKMVKEIVNKFHDCDEHEIIAKIYENIPTWLAPPLSEVKLEIEKSLHKKIHQKL